MAHLAVGVLGSLQVLLDSKPVTTLESDKVRALLVYLAVESHCPHPREFLVGLLWPDCPEQVARHNLRQALFNLRLAIGDRTANPSYLRISHDAIQFNHASDFSLDVAQFNTILHACEEDKSRGIEDPSVHAARLEEMVKLYRGDFLQGFFLADSTEFEEWTLIQRENVHQHVLNACSYLANFYEMHGDYPAARRCASRQLALDPWREEAHCQIMRALALDGQRSTALAQYATCRRVLAEELGVEPSTRTRELFEQIRAGQLKAEYEPPASIPTRPIHHLPMSFTSFHGREQELADLARLIANPECRCISLIGPGGIGKTRLALQSGAQHRADFAHGVAFIPLAPVGSVEEVIPAIVSAIHLYLFGQNDPKLQVLNYLCEKHLLLILDNVEHLLTGGPLQANIVELILEILQSAPGVKLLITSREVLKLQGEWVYEVGGLAYPDEERTERPAEYAAVALFVQRARQAAPEFAFDGAALSEIAHICRLVEGMPLAIELAATWLRTISPVEIAQEIEGSLDVLSAPLRDLPERHRSMRVVFDRSWQRLPAREQQVLSQLSVFRGGFSRPAAEQVAGASLSVLSTLVNRTLLRRVATGRYQLHMLVRQYSATHLAVDPQERAAAQKRHYEFFLALAEAGEREQPGRDRVAWLEQLAQEQDNLRTALEWALEHDSTTPGGDELALRLSGALRRFWAMRGQFHEGHRWLARSLQRHPEGRSAARAQALLGQSLLTYSLGDIGAARLLAEESAAICRDSGDQRGLAEALTSIGLTLALQGEAIMSKARIEEALAVCRAAGDAWREARALNWLGDYLTNYGGYPMGQAMLAGSAAGLDNLEEKFVVIGMVVALGIVDREFGDYATARARFEFALAMAREIESPMALANALPNLGCVHRILGNYSVAQSYLEEALQINQRFACSMWETDVLCALAENALAQGDLGTARSYLQGAAHLLGRSENRWLQMLVRYFRGVLAHYEGDNVAATMLLEETISLAREGHFKPVLARSFVALGRVKRTLGQGMLASDLLTEGLDLHRALQHKLGIANAIEELGAVRAVQGDGVQAVMLFSTAHTLREGLGAPLPPVDRAAHESVLAGCRDQLGETAFAEAWTCAATRPYQDEVDELLNLRENLRGSSK